MCNEHTEGAEDQALVRKGLTRREFAAMTAATALAGCTGTASDGESDGELTEDTVSITMEEGVADGFFVHPVKGTHPGIIMWPDIAGLREAKKIMARRLASAGYAVLVVNQYYRGGPAPLLTSFSEWRKPEGQAKIAPLREQLTPEAVTSDAKAYVAFLDGQDAVDKTRKIGSNGYCMGGPFTVRTAAAVPDRVGAAASFHGAQLVTEEPDSPHRLLEGTEASYLFAIAQNDDEREPEAKDVLRKAAEAAGVPAEIEVYPADHGWCVADSPVWDPTQAERAWNRMLELYSGL